MSELTEEQKLVKLGLRSPNQTESSLTETKDKLQTNIAEEWATFQENFEDANLTSFDDFETWLTNNGFSADTASNIRTKFENKYGDWSTFSGEILNEYESWSDFENDFASNTGLRSTRATDSGLAASGIKVYEESGIGRGGQSIPAGGVEVYGQEVHFSQTGTVRETEDESAGTSDSITWSNLSVSPTGVRIGDIVDISADITNNTTFTGRVVAELIVDGSVNETKTVKVEGNTTETVTFEYTAGEDGTGTFAISVGPLSPIDVTVIYGGL